MQLPTSLSTSLQRLEQTLNRLSAASNPGAQDGSSVVSIAKELSVFAESLRKEFDAPTPLNNPVQTDSSTPSLPQADAAGHTGFGVSLIAARASATTLQEAQSQSPVRGSSGPSSAVDTVTAQNQGAGFSSSAYESWLQLKPEMTGSVAEYSKSLEQWQSQNPRYVDPQRFATFEGYLASVSRSGLPAAASGQGDPETVKSHLLSYFGPIAMANPWATSARLPSAEELTQMPREIQELYSKSMAANRALANLEAAGAVHGDNGTAFLTKNGLS